jgi:8-oxo-dGTP pyrophosphatase MutT (NUDIX family)
VRRSAEPVLRPAGRILVLDPTSRVLLLEHRTGPGGDRTVWAAPGGGCEAGESVAHAAQRELAEECGIVVAVPDGPEIHVERRFWSFGGVTYDQVDHFFVVRLNVRPEVTGAGRSEWEETAVLGHGWFSADECLRLGPRYEPAALPDLLRGLA